MWKINTRRTTQLRKLKTKRTRQIWKINARRTGEICNINTRSLRNTWNIQPRWTGKTWHICTRRTGQIWKINTRRPGNIRKIKTRRTGRIYKQNTWWMRKITKQRQVGMENVRSWHEWTRQMWKTNTRWTENSTQREFDENEHWMQSQRAEMRRHAKGQSRMQCCCWTARRISWTFDSPLAAAAPEQFVQPKCYSQWCQGNCAFKTCSGLASMMAIQLAFAWQKSSHHKQLMHTQCHAAQCQRNTCVSNAKESSAMTWRRSSVCLCLNSHTGVRAILGLQKSIYCAEFGAFMRVVCGLSLRAWHAV